MTKIIAVSRSKEKSAKKEIVAKGILTENYGLIGDAHASDSNLTLLVTTPKFPRIAP